MAKCFDQIFDFKKIGNINFNIIKVNGSVYIKKAVYMDFAKCAHWNYCKNSIAITINTSVYSPWDRDQIGIKLGTWYISKVIEFM